MYFDSKCLKYFKNTSELKGHLYHEVNCFTHIVSSAFYNLHYNR